MLRLYKRVVGLLAGLLLANVVFAQAEFDDAFHSGFDAVLKAHVVDGHVDYPSIATDARFADYLAALQQAVVSDDVPVEQRLAFWINAYNALAIQGILDGKSPSTLLGRLRYFKRDKYRVANRTISLYDIEHEVIIPLGESRIHFAIVCASFSCPPLRAEAFLPSKLETQLAEQADIFVNDSSKNAYDSERGVANLSKIFDWFEDDFVSEAGSVSSYVAQFVRDPAVKQALINGELRLKYMNYDWSLNGTPPVDGG